jgi:hypothetical protein
MSVKKRVYARDYIAEKPSSISSITQKCKGHWLSIDGFGYYVKHCPNTIQTNHVYFEKHDCECKTPKETGPFCSIACGWHKCFNCERLICNSCYRYRENTCVYCVHKSDDCDCDSQEYFCDNSD